MEKLNTETRKKIDEIVARHTGKMGPVKLMLHDVQHECGYIPFEAMLKIADACGVSVAQVYGVVTFYAQFTTQPKGKHVINVCMGTACYVKGAQELLDTICEAANCKVNETQFPRFFHDKILHCTLFPSSLVPGLDPCSP